MGLLLGTVVLRRSLSHVLTRGMVGLGWIGIVGIRPLGYRCKLRLRNKVCRLVHGSFILIDRGYFRFIYGEGIAGDV